MRAAGGPRRTLLILCLLFAGTLVLRMRGIDWLLPHSVEPDVHLAVQVTGFRGGLEDWEGGVDYGKYPHLLARLLQPLPGFVAPADQTAAELRGDLDVHLRRARGTVLEVRYLIALLGALATPLTYLLARRFMPRRGALLASGLVAFSLLGQHYAQQARPHVASATLVLLAVLASLHLRRHPSTRAYALAGGAAALAVASLHNGFAVVLPVAVAHFLAPRAQGLGRRLARVALLALPSLLAVRVCYPFFFTGRSEERGGLLTLESGGLSQSGHSIAWSQFDGAGFGRVLETLVSFEPLLLALVALGLACAVARARGPGDRELADRERRRDLWVVLAYALPYLFVIGLFSLTYQRFVIPLLPYLACCAAWGVTCLTDRVDVRRRAFTTALLFVLILAPTGWATWRLGSLRAAPDNFERAAAWLAANTDPWTERVLVSHGSDLPLARTPQDVRAAAALPRRVRPELWADYQAALLEVGGPQLPLFAGGRAVRHLPLVDRAAARRLHRKLGPWLEELEVDLLVLPVEQRHHDAVAWLLREQALRDWELVARFGTEADERLRSWPFSYATHEGSGEAPHFGLRVLRAEAVGPTVEIYRSRASVAE